MSKSIVLDFDGTVTATDTLDEAAKTFGDACDASGEGSGLACALLAATLATDAKRAAELMTRACDAGFKPACTQK